MCVLKKGVNVRFKFSIIIIMAAAVFLTTALVSDAGAQQSKPKLSPIILDKDTSDPGRLLKS